MREEPCTFPFRGSTSSPSKLSPTTVISLRSGLIDVCCIKIIYFRIKEVYLKLKSQIFLNIKARYPIKTVFFLDLTSRKKHLGKIIEVHGNCKCK
jgi:hypothetical protein